MPDEFTFSTIPARAPMTAAEVANNDVILIYDDSAATEKKLPVDQLKALVVDPLKAPLSSPAFTELPTCPTAAPGTNNTQIANTAYADAAATAAAAAAAAGVVASSPAVLDTLNELAAALGDDENFAATMTTALAGKQPLDAELTAIAGLTSAADKGVQFIGVGAAGTFDLTPAGKAILDDVDAAAQRTTLGLDSLATQNSNSVAITGGAIDGVTIGGTTPSSARTYRPTNSQTGLAYTLVLADNGKLVSLTNAAAITLTVPTDASVAFPVGAEMDLAQLGDGTVTVAPGATVTIHSLGGLLSLSGKYAGAKLKKLAADEWLLTGSLSIALVESVSAQGQNISPVAEVVTINVAGASDGSVNFKLHSSGSSSGSGTVSGAMWDTLSGVSGWTLTGGGTLNNFATFTRDITGANSDGGITGGSSSGATFNVDTQGVDEVLVSEVHLITPAVLPTSGDWKPWGGGYAIPYNASTVDIEAQIGTGNFGSGTVTVVGTLDAGAVSVVSNVYEDVNDTALSPVPIKLG